MDDYRYPDPNLGKNAIALVMTFCLMAAFVMACLKNSGSEGGRSGGSHYSQQGEY